MEAESGFKEKRAYPRLNISIPISCIEPNSKTTVNAYTHDISKQGIGILCEKELPQGASLEVYIKMIDNGEIISAKGTVVWSIAANENKFRIGIRLEDKQIEPIPLALRTIRSQANVRFSGRPLDA